MKAVTDTKYYDEIARQIQIDTGYSDLKPSEMAKAIEVAVSNTYTIGKAQGRQALESELLGGAW